MYNMTPVNFHWTIPLTCFISASILVSERFVEFEFQFKEIQLTPAIVYSRKLILRVSFSTWELQLCLSFIAELLQYSKYLAKTLRINYTIAESRCFPYC
jgi:hypothetical protein